MIFKISKDILEKLKRNPNLQGWISLKDQTVNIQDIPPVPESRTIEQIIDESKINKNIESLKIINKKKKTLLEKVSFDDPKKYETVKKFIIERGLKLYGGTAINYYLPKENKIYKEDENPDYDFYSPDPWNDATDLADIFYKQGYDFVEARAGIHPGTYKVFVNLWPVADLTYMPKEAFDNLETETVEGIKIVSPFKLFEAFYKELSEPFGNIDRWKKIYEREKILFKEANPLKNFNCDEKIILSKDNEEKKSAVLSSLFESSLNFFIRKKCIFTGTFAYNSLLDFTEYDEKFKVNHLEVLSNHAKMHVTNLFNILNKKLEKEYRQKDKVKIKTNYYPGKEHNSICYEIVFFDETDSEYKTICKIFQLSICTPFIKIGNKRIASIDYLNYELYNSIVFSTEPYRKSNLKCIFKHLNMIKEQYYKNNNISEIDISPFGRLVTKCVGPFGDRRKQTILERSLDRRERNKKIKEKIEGGYKIRKIPIEKIPERCDSLSKERCVYPCGWNKVSERCSGIPNMVYEPYEIQKKIKSKYRRNDL